MQISILITLPLQQAAAHFSLLHYLTEFRRCQRHTGAALAAVVSPEDWPMTFGVDADFLVICLPDSLASAQSALASQPVDVYNLHSPDMLECRTMLVIEAGDVAIEIDAWKANFFRGTEEHGRFYVGFAAADQFILTVHRGSPEQVGALLGAIQAACAASGSNYKPERTRSATADYLNAGEADVDLRVQAKHRLECEVVFPIRGTQ